MARISKTSSHFDIYDNHHADLPTPDSTYHFSFDEGVLEKELADGKIHVGGRCVGDGFVTESEEEAEGQVRVDNDGDYQRRLVSNVTRTSISSMPDSMYPTDHERSLPQMHSPYTPSRLRPSYRRANMTTPSPFSARSSRDVRGYRSKTATPRSDVKDSSRARREEESKLFPLVLLHVTLLPVDLSWPADTMRELLPQHVLGDIQLLRSKASDTLLKRGILIPHPEDDYEILEERLLEALELEEGRITKCGHFRGRSSTSSMSTFKSDGGDSGLGFSDEGLDGDLCLTCEHPISASSTRRPRWSVRVYAANGLMRSNTWAAAWSEMERVDVEIMPWISDDLRMSLDEKTAEHDARELQEVPRNARSGREVDFTESGFPESSKEVLLLEQEKQSSLHSQNDNIVPGRSPNPPQRSELPAIYRSKDIPLSILLRNYLLLLLQDRRIVAGFFVGLIALFFAVQFANPLTSNSGILIDGVQSHDESLLSSATEEDEVVEVLQAENESEFPFAEMFASQRFDTRSPPGYGDDMSLATEDETLLESLEHLEHLEHPALSSGTRGPIDDCFIGTASRANRFSTMAVQPVDLYGLQNILQICVADSTD